MRVVDNHDEEYSERDLRYIRRKSILDAGMGILWISMGVFMIFIRYFNTGLEARYDDPMMKIFGGICLFYGSFRIYRAIRKNYFR